jgi:hypothetical protein
MATIRKQIQEARKEGYSDSEIAAFLSEADPRIAEAFSEGYKLDQIANYVNPEDASFLSAMRPEITRPEVLGTIGTALGRTARSAIQGFSSPASMVLDPFYQMAGMQPASQQQAQALTSLGLPEYPEGMLGRIQEGATEALGGAASQITAAAQIAKQGITPLARSIAERFSAQPTAQLAVTPPAAAVSQTTLEATGSPVAALAAGGATGALGGVRPRRFEAGPSAEDLAMQAKGQYQKATDAGVVVVPKSVQSLSARLSKEAKDLGYDPDLHPGVRAVLRRLSEEGSSPKTLDDLEVLRRVVRAPASDALNKDQQRIATQLIRKFDDFVSNLGPNDISAGNAPEAISALKNARQLYARNIKSDIIEDIMNKTDLSSTQYSQSGLENSIRVQFRTLAKNKTKMAQFSKEEQAQIRKIVKGDTLQNMLRFVGKFAPTGVVSALPTAGAAALNPYLAPVVPLVSFPARKAAEQMGMSNIDMLTQMIRLGRPPTLEQARLGMVPQTMTRGLLSSQSE